jgi:hypothetical protein
MFTRSLNKASKWTRLSSRTSSQKHLKEFACNLKNNRNYINLLKTFCHVFGTEYIFKPE